MVDSVSQGAENAADPGPASKEATLEEESEVKNVSYSFWAEIRHRGAQILASGWLADCSFLVGDDSKPVLLKAHKIFLASASPVFEAMFYGGLSNPGPVRVLEIEPDVFQGMLEFIYSDDLVLPREYNARLGVPCLVAETRYKSHHAAAVQEMLDKSDESFDFVYGVYYAAHKYLLTSLQKACVSYLTRCMTLNNLCYIFEFAVKVENAELIENCFKKMNNDVLEVLQSEAFLMLDLDAAESLFSSTELSCTELEVLEAAERYSRALAKRDTGPGPVDTAAYDTSIPIAIPSAILQHIRFLAMSPKLLAEYEPLPSMLSQDVVFALMMNTASKDTYVPMPIGFSKCRSPRARQIQNDHATLDYTNDGIEAEKARTEASFITTVNNITRLKHFQSVQFFALEKAWRVSVRHVQEYNEKPLLMVTLMSGSERNPEGYEYSVVMRKNSVIMGQKMNGRIHNSKYKDWQHVVDPANDYVRCDAITLEVHVKRTEHSSDKLR